MHSVSYSQVLPKSSNSPMLGRVDGFDQDECAGECDERGEVLAVFSQRRAIRLKRLTLPTACSIRARPL